MLSPRRLVAHTVSAADSMSRANAASKSTSNFCIDALLAKEDRLKSPHSTPSLSSSSAPASPVLSPDARSSGSPSLINGSYVSRRTPNVPEHLGSDLRASKSPLWSPLSSSANIQVCSALANSHPHQNNHVHHAANIAMSSLFPSASAHPLYAAMYGASHPHGLQNASGGNPGNSLPLIHGSAFHSPFHDMKGHPSGALPIDWLARAGLLYHRSSGK